MVMAMTKTIPNLPLDALVELVPYLPNSQTLVAYQLSSKTFALSVEKGFWRRISSIRNSIDRDSEEDVIIVRCHNRSQEFRFKWSCIGHILHKTFLKPPHFLCRLEIDRNSLESDLLTFLYEKIDQLTITQARTLRHLDLYSHEHRFHVEDSVGNCLNREWKVGFRGDVVESTSALPSENRYAIFMRYLQKKLMQSPCEILNFSTIFNDPICFFSIIDLLQPNELTFWWYDICDSGTQPSIGNGLGAKVYELVEYCRSSGKVCTSIHKMNTTDYPFMRDIAFAFPNLKVVEIKHAASRFYDRVGSENMLSAEKMIGALVLAHSGYEWLTVLKPYKIVEKVVLNATCKDNLFNVIREVFTLSSPSLASDYKWQIVPPDNKRVTDAHIAMTSRRYNDNFRIELHMRLTTEPDVNIYKYLMCIIG